MGCPRFNASKWATGLLAAGGLTSSMAQAQTITMTGTVANLCVLTLTTPGVIAVDPTGMELSTTQTGGVAASMTVVATGTNPTITFTAPGLTGPSASGATAEMAFTSPAGASNPYSSSGYVYAMSQLLDTITINGRATKATGFQSGVYNLTSTATCAQ
ncbi:MAG: hypothetical protein R3E11_10180 [Sphingobium sp.]|nr:hypothetical protein [Sphingobium sp.]MCP5399735.1 hypothetical protein [Sphingomonas sp.]